MDVEFDPAKDVENRRKHGISLKRAEDFDLPASVTFMDDREDYGEMRFRSIGFLNARLYALIFTIRGDNLRAISLRKATGEEAQEYVERT